MRSLSVHIQPERSPGFDLAAATTIFSEIARDEHLVRHHAFDHGRDSRAYYNFTFGTEEAGDLWREIERRLFEDPVLGEQMRRISIATCSSETGWDDYLLLFHFDPAVSLDSPAALAERQVVGQTKTMSKTANCPTHGQQAIGFVCSHVARAIDSREQVGFFWGDDTDTARPDAWCAACEQKLVALNGASCERWFVEAEFKILCVACWDEARRILYEEARAE